jgi:hypothetical protein
MRERRNAQLPAGLQKGEKNGENEQKREDERKPRSGMDTAMPKREKIVAKGK